MENTNTSGSPVWAIEFNDRIQAFADTTGISVEIVKKTLSNLGVDGTKEQSLAIIDSDEFLPINDLFEAFVDSGLTKKSLLRAAMPHLRGKTYLGETSNSVNGEILKSIKDIAEANRPLASLSDDQLLDKYDESSTEVAKILRERTHGRTCIVFNKNGTVNKSVSLELIKAAKKQQTPDKYSANGKVVRTYRAGDFPLRPLDESPFFSGFALVNGYCARSDTQWKDISHEKRVFVRVLTGHCRDVSAVYSKLEMKRIWKDAFTKDIEELKEEYGEAALVYEEMQANDTLPKLKVIPESTTTKLDNGF
jgi:hypothetical protein